MFRLALPCRSARWALSGLPQPRLHVPAACNRGRRRVSAAPQARLRSTGRATGQAQPPPDPTRSQRAYRTQKGQRSRPEREPFDAELLVLFGLPALVLLVAYAFNEPGQLVVAVPLLLLIPGPRDVILHVASDLFNAARRARRFVSMDPDDYEAGADAAAERRPTRREWSRRAPPPPPPPPPAAATPAAVDYELQQGEYSVQPPTPSPIHDTWPPQQPQQVPRSPFADGWPPAAGGAAHAADAWQQQQQPMPPAYQQQQQYAPRSPFADGWPPAAGGAAHAADAWQQQQQQQQQHPMPPAAQPQQIPRSPFADGWPPAPGGSAWQPPQRVGGQPAAGWDGAARGAVRRRAARGSGPNAAALPASRQRQGSTLARPASRSRRGADPREGRDRDATPLLLRPLFALIPFLRHWGGFL